MYPLFHIKLLISVAILAIHTKAITQSTITGTVTSSLTGEPLAGASIYIKGTLQGAASDRNGSYSLNATADPPFSLLYSHVGFRIREVNITSRDTTVHIVLQVDPETPNEILITAQRREQRMQEVPMSISAYNPGFLENSALLNYLPDLSLYTPCLTAAQLTATSQFYNIRGIGSDTYGIGSESSVGVFLDDFYVGRVSGGLALLDVARIEVVKVPQSTLFGRNTSAGAISIHSHNAVNYRDGYIQLGLGNEGQKTTEYMLNLPLSNRLSFRIAGLSKFRDGLRTVTNLDNQALNELHLFANRLSLNWDVPGDWVLRFSIEHQKSDGEGWDYFSINTGLGSSGDPFDREIELSRKNDNDFESTLVRLDISKQLSNNLHLKSLTGYRAFNSSFSTDGDATPLFILDYIQPEDTRNFSQEFRLEGEYIRSGWVLGGSYFYDDTDTDITVLYDDHAFIGGIPIGANDLGFEHPAFSLCDELSSMFLGPCSTEAREYGLDKSLSHSFGVFGDLTLRLNDLVNLTAGLRLSVDNKKFTSNSQPGAGLTPTIFGGNLLGPDTDGQDISNEETFKAWQPRVAVDYSPSEGVLLYGSYTKGYKAGGFNNVTAVVFGEEESDAFELGFKSLFNSGKIRVNGAFYYTNYRDLQVQLIAEGTGLLFVDNAAEVESKGLELESTFNFEGGFSLSGNLSLGQARFENYEEGDRNFNGNAPGRSPDQSYSLIAQYQKPIQGGSNLYIRLDYGYQSKIYFSRENAGHLSQDGYGLFNANIGVNGLLNNRLDIGLFGHNIFDKEYLLQAEDPLMTGPAVLRSIPRLLGVKLSYRIFNL